MDIILHAHSQLGDSKTLRFLQAAYYLFRMILMSMLNPLVCVSGAQYIHCGASTGY
jgi:hypothetical protein